MLALLHRLEVARIGLAAESSAQRHDPFSRLILEQFCPAPEADGAAVDACDPQALHELGLVFYRSKKYVRNTGMQRRVARAHLY